MEKQFEWTIKASVGDNTIDEHHNKFLVVLNDLTDALLCGRGGEKLVSIIDFFDEFASVHVSYEERYMLEIGYPKFKEHKIMHDGFIEKCKCIRSDFEKDGPCEAMAIQIGMYMGNWWVSHICREDQKYKKFVETGKC